VSYKQTGNYNNQGLKGLIFHNIQPLDPNLEQLRLFIPLQRTALRSVLILLTEQPLIPSCIFFSGFLIETYTHFQLTPHVLE